MFWTIYRSTTIAGLPMLCRVRAWLSRAASACSASAVRAPLLNNDAVDGADDNQAIFSEERGRTTVGYSTPKVTIQEFQINK